MKKYEFGLIGLAVMGQNFARNVARHGHSVAVFNRTVTKTESFVECFKNEGDFFGAKTIEEFVNALEKPRKIMLLVKAGEAVDKTISSLLPFLDKDDIIIDGGNSYFADTRRRYSELEKLGIRFMGMGVSGGEEGALNGPSLMPGGDRSTYEEIAPIMKEVAAQVKEGACFTYVGQDGAGHYVKMVHNGIEYGDMELISEAYFLMKEVLGMTASEIGDVFAKWNKGVLDSYLIEITAKILKKVDEETGKPLVELILDKAGQKGTGKWTSQEGLELGVAIPTIAEAVFARGMSAYKDERIEAKKVLSGPKVEFTGDKEEFIEAIHSALYASKICSYAQGFALIREAANVYGWDINYGDMALLWRGGCIIRAAFLENIKAAFTNNKDLKNLLVDPYFAKEVMNNQENWRKTIVVGVLNGIPLPAFTASLNYYDSYRRDFLPANMIQAQRDFFGAHTYNRIDKEGVFHTEWEQN